MNYIRNEAVKLESSYALSEFLSGIRFQMRLDTFEIRLLVPRREIVRYNEIYPNWHFIMKGLCVKLGFLGKEQVNQVTLKEISIIDYYKQGSGHQAAVAYAQDALTVKDD